jgi:SAM-dependent methyltransferase
LFEAAHFSEVLEHIPDPEEFLLNVKKILKDEGIIVITVPNDYNPLQKIFISETGKEKWWLAPPFHLNYFSHKSLADLVKRCGYEILESTSMFPIDLFLLMGDDYVGNDLIGKESHARRKNFENVFSKHNNQLMRELYISLANLGIGREIVMYAKKKSER